MTKEEYRALIAYYGLNQRQASEVLGVDERTGRRYALKGVPPHKGAWVRETLASDVNESWADQFALSKTGEKEDYEPRS